MWGHHGGNAVPGLGGVNSSVISVTASQAQVVGDNQTKAQVMWGQPESHAVLMEDSGGVEAIMVDIQCLAWAVRGRLPIMSGTASQEQVVGDSQNIMQCM